MLTKAEREVIEAEHKAMALTMQYGNPDHPEVLKARKALSEAKRKLKGS